MELKLDFKFDAAHRLMHHAGLCRNIHGHTWKVRVTVEGEVDEKSGMVVDFRVLKGVIGGIIDGYDHCIILNDEDLQFRLALTDITKVTTVSREPTCENISRYLFMILAGAFAYHSISVRLVEVHVWESETASAVYRREEK